MKRTEIPVPPYKAAVELLFDGCELNSEHAIWPKIKGHGPVCYEYAIRVFYKGKYKDGTDHYEVALNRDLIEEMDSCSRHEK